MNEISKNQSKNEIELTEQNWLMFKYIQAGKTVKDAYKLAGYLGTSIQAPYQVYKIMKKKIEAIWDADNADSLRLKMETKKIADMPLRETTIKAETKLKAIETLHKLQDKDNKTGRVITPFIVFKDNGGQITASQGEVVDAKVVEENENG